MPTTDPGSTTTAANLPAPSLAGEVMTTGPCACGPSRRGKVGARRARPRQRSSNMDANLKPDNYYSWGQSVDIRGDPYYQRRLTDTYWGNPQWIPLYYQSYPYIYAVSRAVCSAAEPNPTSVILYSCQYRNPSDTSQIWPFPTQASKRQEVYYALAGGAKGLCYWWMPTGWPADELSDQNVAAAQSLWYEMGLCTMRSKRSNPCSWPAARWTWPLPSAQRLGGGAGLGHQRDHSPRGQPKLLE